MSHRGWGWEERKKTHTQVLCSLEQSVLAREAERETAKDGKTPVQHSASCKGLWSSEGKRRKAAEEAEP